MPGKILVLVSRFDRLCLEPSLAVLKEKGYEALVVEDEDGFVREASGQEFTFFLVYGDGCRYIESVQRLSRLDGGTPVLYLTDHFPPSEKIPGMWFRQFSVMTPDIVIGTAKCLLIEAPLEFRTLRRSPAQTRTASSFVSRFS